jgi:hypothetical protein
MRFNGMYTVHINECQPASKASGLMLAGLLGFVFLSAFFQVSDCDVGYHLRTAAHILAGNSIPTTNTFSSATPEHPWLLHQWLGTIIFYLPFAVGGVGGLIVFKAGIAVLIMLLVWLRARDLSTPGSWVPFWVVTAAAIGARVRFFERPDLLSALFFALLLRLDCLWGENRRWQWVGLPLLMAAWANTHAGVIYGFTLLSTIVGAEWLEWSVERARRGACSSASLKVLIIRPVGFAVSAVAACLTVQMINPNGWRVLWFPISQFTSKFWQSIILEYQPPTWAGEKAFYLFSVGVIVLQALTVKRINLRLLLVSAVFGYLGCRSQRSLLFFVIAAAPHASYMLSLMNSRGMESRSSFSDKPAAVLGQNATSASPGPYQQRSESSIPISGEPSLSIPTRRRWEMGALLGVWALVVMVVFVPNRTFRFGAGWYHPYYPLEIYQFVAKEVPQQGVFNEMRYGGSMLWWLYPRFKPFIDGRGDAYSETFWLKEYFPLLEAKTGWRDVLKAHDVHCALLPFPELGEPLPLVQALLSDPQWALVAFNDQTVAFLERTETNRQIIAKREFKVLRPGDWSFTWAESADAREQGAAEVERLLEASPDSRFARTAKVRLFMSSGRFAEAVNELRGILSDYPEAGQMYWRDYGYALCRIGQLDTADKVFSRMISKNQLSGFACFMRYHIALQRQDLTTARRFLTRALSIEPGNPEYCLARTNLDQTILTQ